MKDGLLPGASVQLSARVTAEMTARLEGRELHPVLATHWMGYHFEVAARRVLEPFLEPDEEGVGYRLEVEHVRPVPVGATLELEAVFTGFRGPEMLCTVEARWRGELVGKGRQGQRILSRRELDERFRRLRPEEA